MAIGDDALAAGMPLMTGAEQANTLDTEINLTRDIVAQRTSTVMPIAKGGTGATSVAAARSALGVPSTTEAVANGDTGNPIRLTASGARARLRIGGTDRGDVAYVADVDAVRSDFSGTATTASQAKDGFLSSAVYGRTLGGSYRVAYVGSDGTLGWVSSSRRHKKNIKPAEVDVSAVLAMQLVTFLYKVEVDTHRLGELQHGLIAEDLDDLGLAWLVDYADDGTPEGVRYDRLALALLPVLQDQHAQIDALADRVAEIEAHLDALGGDHA